MNSKVKNDARRETITRETILKLLSDDEIARVSNAETAPHLSQGDEYVDLHAPDRGVLLADNKHATTMGRVLPKNAVREQTWREIVLLLAAHKNSKHS